MKIFVNQKIRRLFAAVLLAISAAAALSAVWAAQNRGHGAGGILLLFAGMALFIFTAMYRYFREQNRLLEEATAQVRALLSGIQSARIPCLSEGELYRLFHEINSLAAVLNAHAENEKKAKQFLKQTISDISHQLKTPLAALNVYNGPIQQEAEKLPSVMEFSLLSEQELDRISVLVQNLLNITKLDAKTLVMEKRMENVSAMLHEACRPFAWRAKAEQKSLLLSGKEDVFLPCDAHWLGEAIGNLVKNGLDHTKPGDTVEISWREYASMVQICIKDNGSGIHPEDLPYIFKRFYRSRFSKDTQGIGLGLSLAKAIVEAHGGTVEADSEKGNGAVFTLSIPES